MKQQTGFRLSEEALRLLDAFCARHGLTRTAVLEMLIRDAARQQGLHADTGVQTQDQPRPTRRDR